MNHQALSSFIWSDADLLRGDYKQSEYGKVILPLTILRRLDSRSVIGDFGNNGNIGSRSRCFQSNLRNQSHSSRRG